MKIREANILDADGIAKVHVDSWRATYKGIMPEELLNHLSYESRTELWKKNISDKNNYIVIAENEEGQVIAFVTAGKRETNLVENSGDLTSIYACEEYKGKGIGKKLLQEAFSHFKTIGYNKIFVEVLEDNKTKYFYEYYGAELVNTVQIKIGGKVLNESIYEWDSIDKVLAKLQITKLP
ncbi:N-acetyltransferase family protein [Bacillus sp. 1P06AnD]|uniref:GNAT family N-acetyltransferase n=1 Tax=Bacillus sp. 1P06AnD TaxID=3132208 RepID=UPI00399FDEE7